MPLVTCVIGTSSSGTPAQTSFHNCRLTEPCNALTPFEWRLVRSARIVMLKVFSGLTLVWPKWKNSSKVSPTLRGVGTKVFLHQVSWEGVVSGGDGRVRRENIRRCDGLQRL